MRRALAGVAVTLAAAGTVVALVGSAGQSTSYAVALPWGSVVTLLAGYGLMLAGLAVGFTASAAGQAARTWRWIGRLGVATGLVWLAPIWIGWWEGPTLIRSITMLVAPFLLPLLVHLVVLVAGATATHLGRIMVAVGYSATMAMVLVKAVFHHPIQELHCWANCTVNVFFWRPMPDLVRLMETIWALSAIALILLAAAIGISAMWSATTVGRAQQAPVLIPAMLAALAQATYVALLLIEPAEDPAAPRFALAYLIQAGSLMALAAGLCWTLVRIHRRRRAVDQLVEALDPALGEGWPLAAGLGAAARLALDNERLRAEALAHLAALRASRARIVAAADESRSRIERDLHDGTQQSLISLLFELRVALASAQKADDPERAASLTYAVNEAERCVAELREIAHGIYPAVLDESGLAAALWTLADRAPMPVEFGPLPEQPLPAVVERTTYALIKGIIDEAGRQNSPGLRISIHHQQNAVVVELEGAPEADYLHLADRVGATGGDLMQRGRRLRVEIPCEL